MSIQSIIISKDFYTLPEALYIMNNLFKIKYLKVHETSKKYRFRIREPDPNKRYWTEDDNIFGGIKYVIFV